MREFISKYSEKELTKIFPQTANNAIIKRGSIVRLKLNEKGPYFTVLLRRGKSAVLSPLDGTKELKMCELSELRVIPLYEVIQLKRYFDVNERIKEINFSDAVSMVRATILKIYPRERFEVIYRPEGDIQITIHYPEIKITNSFESEHTMKDLYLRFFLNKSSNNGNLWISEIKIIRTTFEDKEVSEGGRFYVFSHLPIVGDPLNFKGGLCYGGSTPTNKMVQSYETKVEFTQIQSFLLAMESYFSWESLEGTPYVKMDEFFSKNGRSPSLAEFFVYNSGHNKVRALAKEIILNSQLDKFTFRVEEDYEGSKIKVGISPEIINVAISVIDRMETFSETKHLLIGKIVNGVEIFDGNGRDDSKKSTISKYNGKEVFTFNSKPVVMRIEQPQIAEDGEEPVYILNPEMYDKLSSYLGDLYLKYLLNKKLYEQS